MGGGAIANPDDYDYSAKHGIAIACRPTVRPAVFDFGGLFT